MVKMKLLILLSAAFLMGFLISKLSTVSPETKEEPCDLVNGFAYLEALEKAADLVEGKVFCDGRLRQVELNKYSALASSIREAWVDSLETEIALSDDFSFIEKEFWAEHWAWKEEFDREMSKRSVYSGGTAERMDLSSRRAALFSRRAIALKSKWLSRIPTPYFKEPQPPTEEELEEWRKIEEDLQNEDCEEDQV